MQRDIPWRQARTIARDVEARRHATVVANLKRRVKRGERIAPSGGRLELGEVRRTVLTMVTQLLTIISEIRARDERSRIALHNASSVSLADGPSLPNENILTRDRRQGSATARRYVDPRHRIMGRTQPRTRKHSPRSRRSKSNASCRCRAERGESAPRRRLLHHTGSRRTRQRRRRPTVGFLLIPTRHQHRTIKRAELARDIDLRCSVARRGQFKVRTSWIG